MIIGVTDEPPALVDSWVASVKPIYPIVSTQGRELEEFLGVKFFPTVAVVSPQGVLEYAGSTSGPYQAPLKAAMKDTEKGALLPKVFNKVQKKLDDAEFSDAYAELIKLLDAPKSKLDERETVIGQQWRDWIEGQAAADVVSARQLLEDGWVYQALLKVQPVAEAKPPYPATPDALALVEQMEALEGYKDEVKGGMQYAEALELARSKSKRDDALDLLDKLAKKYADRSIGEHARQAAASMRSN